MSDLIKRIRNYLFGTQWVTLIHYDGERSVRKVKHSNAISYAECYHGISGPSFLLDNGTTSGTIYVTHWEPYIPGTSKKV
jgi:hypothetical protein